MLYQASGKPNGDYEVRFLETAAALEQALRALLECKVDLTADGTAYEVYFAGGRIAGPNRQKEQAMATAVKRILEIRYQEAQEQP